MSHTNLKEYMEEARKNMATIYAGKTKEKSRRPVEGEMVTNDKGAKQSHVDARVDLIPPENTLLLGECLAYGADRYGENNWKNISERDNINHALIHLLKYLSGDRSEPHLVNCLARTNFALYHAIQSGDQPLKYEHPNMVKDDTVLEGVIQDVQIFSKMLTPEEIQVHAVTGKVVEEHKPIAGEKWRLHFPEIGMTAIGVDTCKRLLTAKEMEEIVKRIGKKFNTVPERKYVSNPEAKPEDYTEVPARTAEEYIQAGRTDRT